MDGQDPQTHGQGQDPQADATGAGQATPMGTGQQAGAGDGSQAAGGQASGNQGAAQAGTAGAGSAAQAAGDQGAAQAGTAGAGQTDDKSFLRPRPPDTDLGIGTVGVFATSVHIPPHPNTTFDEAYFLKMLSGSISLTKNEKKKIVQSIGKLSQYQVDELIKIFEEERRKFAELDEKHQVKIRELQAKQQEDWRDLELEEQQVGKAEEDAAAAEALKAQLMGGGAAADTE